MSLLCPAPIDRAVRLTDGLRRQSPRRPGSGGHQEWQHFCVHSPGLDVVVNFSLVQDRRPSATPGAERYRVTVLVRTDEWQGAVEEFGPAQVRARQGQVALDYGPNQLRFEDGAYRLRVRLRDHPVALDLCLVPQLHPTLCTGVPVGASAPLDWLVLPRLLATGQVTVGGQRFELGDAVAYHDHNWGHFSWGAGFSWEWGYGIGQDAEDPWSVVFVRLLDQGGARVFTQGLFIWRGPQPFRVLRDRELSVAHDGLIRAQRPFRIPRVSGLLVPSDSCAVPARVQVEGRGEGDRISFSFETRDLAQVVIPKDEDPTGLAVINEAYGDLKVQGDLRGERISLSGPAFYEVVHA